MGIAQHILDCITGTDNDDDLIGKEVLIMPVFGSILY